MLASGAGAVGGLMEGREAVGGGEEGGVVQEVGLTGFDPRQQAAVEDMVRHGGLEGGVAHEHDHGMKAVGGQTEEFRERLHMEQVLVERVLELALVAVDLLDPLRLLDRAENPALVVFGLDDKPRFHPNCKRGRC